MRTFEDIYELACLRKGGEKEVLALLPKAKTSSQLIKAKDSWYLSTLSRRIFRAGLKHEMVDKKWPAFEKRFRDFDIHYCAMLSDEDIDELMTDTSIIRHLGKIRSIRTNAQFVLQSSKDNNGFGRFLAEWPSSDIVSLWTYLKKHGQQLGGQSGPYFLRMAGKDTFLLTRDVVAVLKADKVIDKAPTAQKDFRAAQEAFNQWQEESGLSLCEISRLVSYCSE